MREYIFNTYWLVLHRFIDAKKKAILTHPEISECAVVELHDEVKGVVPFAFLIRTNGKVFSNIWILYINYSYPAQEQALVQKSLS